MRFILIMHGEDAAAEDREYLEEAGNIMITKFKFLSFSIFRLISEPHGVDKIQINEISTQQV